MSFRALLEPVLSAHAVPLVFQGHNHVYERLVVGGIVGEVIRLDGTSIETFTIDVP